jgi:hypothetical protein
MMETKNAPLPERVKYFRDLAGKSQRDAQRSRGALRLAFLRLAKGWESLADASEELLATQAVELGAGAIDRREALAEPGSHDRAL